MFMVFIWWKMLKFGKLKYYNRTVFAEICWMNIDVFMTVSCSLKQNFKNLFSTTTSIAFLNNKKQNSSKVIYMSSHWCNLKCGILSHWIVLIKEEITSLVLWHVYLEIQPCNGMKGHSLFWIHMSKWINYMTFLGFMIFQVNKLMKPYLKS